MATWNDAAAYTWDELNTWDDPIPANVLIDVTGSGGVVVGGAATVTVITPSFVAGSGGVKIGGTADVVVSGVVSIIAAGGVEISGAAETQTITPTFVVGSGGVAAGGAATVAFVGPPTFVAGSGGVELGGSATVRYIAASVSANVKIEWDFDNDGDFSEAEEDITDLVMSLETRTGRDFPSQLTGRVDPGELRLTLKNIDNRFNYFNASSPYNQGDFTLKTGRKIRVRTASSAPDDPVLLSRDRFPTVGYIFDEMGHAWNTPTGLNNFTRGNGTARPSQTDGPTINTITLVGVFDYYVQVRVGGIDTRTLDGESTKIGIVYRYVDADDYSLFIADGAAGELQMVDVVAGVSTEIGSYAVDTYDGMTLGVLVAGTSVTGYLDGVAVVNSTAINGSAIRFGMYADLPSVIHQVPYIEQFYAWDHLPAEVEGVLWTGRVSELTTDITVGDVRVANLSAIGPMEQLANSEVTPPYSIDGRKTGMAVASVLSQANMLHPPGPIDEGDVTTGAFGSDKDSALEISRQFEEAELGLLYETQEGHIGFESRSARDLSTSQATFADTDGAQLGYHSFSPRDWRQEIFNRVEAGLSSERVGGITIESFTGNVSLTDAVEFTPSTAPDPGDLMMVIASVAIPRTANFQWEARDWSVLDSTNDQGQSTSFKVLARVADGTESDLQTLARVTEITDDVTPDTGCFSIAYLRVTDWFGSISDGVAISDTVTNREGTAGWTAGADAPVVFTPGDVGAPSFVVTTLFGASSFGGFVEENTDVAAPVGYTLDPVSPIVDESADTFYHTGLAIATKHTAAGLDNPTAWMDSTGNIPDWRYNRRALMTIAIRGSNGSPPSNDARTVVSNDLDSQADYDSIRTYVNPATIFASTADGETYGDLVLARFSDAHPIFELKFWAATSPQHRQQAYQRRVSDRITVDASHDAGQGVSGDFFIESISHVITNGGKVWETTWELSPVPAEG